MRNDTQNLTGFVNWQSNFMFDDEFYNTKGYNIEVNYKKKKRCDNYYYMNCLGQLWVRVNVVLECGTII